MAKRSHKAGNPNPSPETRYKPSQMAKGEPLTIRLPSVLDEVVRSQRDRTQWLREAVTLYALGNPSLTEQDVEGLLDRFVEAGVISLEFRSSVLVSKLLDSPPFTTLENE